MKICPACSRENPADARFCSGCGAPLDERTAREERKVVSVLFCDLVGSTAQAERLDPEDVRALLSRYHERVRVELERFGGTVEKFIGDAVMALFGAPVAHEDDPERAVRAALAIRDAAQQDGEFRVRVGITTGEALIALGARPDAGEGMASGDVVNTAARLQSAAPVDGILVDETTYRATQRAIEYREHAPVEAKGKADAISVWEPLEPRARFGVDVAQEIRTALVGRKTELDLLIRTFERVREAREPQLVTLVGVPGIGKSRLVHELFRHLYADPDLTTWRQGRSLPYGEGVSYWALAEMVKAEAGILETDAAAETARKLHASIDGLGLENRDWVGRHLRPLVGAETGDLTHGDVQAEAFAAWRQYLEALADRRPLVLVFEDLHWADDALLDFVDELVEWSSDVPLLVVATARPELLAQRPAWGGGKPNATTLSLSPLTRDETSRLVHALLERAVLPVETQSALLERAEGNPLYAEEFARLVLEGREPDELPEGVQGLIAARLDALESGDKELLQNAAVLGKVFWAGGVAHLAGADRHAVERSLHGLVRRELAQRARHASIAGETEYAFRHTLVRDVAYGQIPRGARSEKHLRAAEWIESLGRAEDKVEVLAHHYVAALDLAGAASQPTEELAERTRRVLRAAGDRALALAAYPAAQGFYQRALELSSETDDEYAYLLLGAGKAGSEADMSGEDLLEAATSRLLELGDRAAAAEAAVRLSHIAWYRGDRAAASARLEQAGHLVDGLPPSIAKARVLSHIARRQMTAGDPAVIELGRQALSLAEELDLPDVRSEASITIGSARCLAGDPDGSADIEAGIEIAETAGLPQVTRGYINLGYVLSVHGDPQARELAEQALRAAERFGQTYSILFIRGNLADGMYHAGEWDEALAIADDLIATAVAGSPHYQEPQCYAVRTLIRVARGDGDGAAADARRGLERAREIQDPQVVTPWLAIAAYVELQTGDRDVAARLVQELGARDLTSDKALALGASVLELLDAFALGAELSRGELGTPSRYREAALAFVERDYVRAAAIYDEIGARVEEAYARLRAAEAFVKEGRRAEADEQLERALAFYRSVGATRYIGEAEALLRVSA
ncbi:MAG: AAA family ATPase [Actinobacteria bacterium]|nr:AAA family ATPase [Actinomycetota bacterium]